MSKNEQTFWAHSENEEGDPHFLEEHLRNTARLCEQFADGFDVEKIGYYLGLLHDMGKYSDGFQDYLREENNQVGPDHKKTGTQVIAERAPFLGFPIAGHHGGMPDRAKLKDFVKSGGIHGNILDRYEHFIDDPILADFKNFLPSRTFYRSF